MTPSMPRFARLLGPALLFLTLAPARAGAGEDERDWPRWRGIHYDDTSRARDVFGRPFALRLRWRRALGSGYSGVSVRGDTAVTLASSGGEDFVVALDAATGAERWRQRIGPAFPGQDGAVDGPVSTPTLSEDTVYALGPRGELLALALADGTPRWSRDLAREFSASRPYWGFTSAPLCVGELVVVAAGAGEGRAFLAFAARDGDLRWSAGSDAVHYQSPILTELDGRELVLGVGNTALHGLDPETGAEVLRVPHGGLDFYQEILQPLALGEGRFLLKNQRLASRCVTLTAGARAAEEVWSTRHLRQNYNLSVLHEGLLFGHGGSFLSCVDAETGELLWRSRPPGDGWEILVDGHLVILTKDGGLHVARAGPDGYEERAGLELFEHLVWTPPSFARGCVFARDSESDVACVEIVPAPSSVAGRVEPAAPASTLLEELARRVADADVDAGTVLDEFLTRQTSVPVLEGERTVHFFYRGPGQDLALQGDFLDDTVALPMTRLPGTDLFHASCELEPDARIGYQLVRDLDEVLADPLNPRTTPSMTLVGPVSVLCLPRAAPLERPSAGPPAPRGSDESFVLDVPVRSFDGRRWGGPRRVWVHLPPGYEEGHARYPVLVVNDGANAREALALPELLDELSGREMAPVIAVFVELQGGYELARSQQEPYRDLLVETLVPYLDAHYRTLARADARAVLGQDEGAYAALFAALTRPRVFGTALAQSLYHGSSQGQAVLLGLVSRAEELPTVRLDWGRYDARDPRTGLDTARASRELAEALARRGARVTTQSTNDGDQCAFWRARLPALLAQAFPPAGGAAR